MLWMKAWLETRWRLLFALGIPLAALAFRLAGGVASPDEARRWMVVLAFFVTFGAVFLAGAGVKTQAAFQAVKGLHGSMYYTLSLPVSRLRLLAVRVGIGLLETAVVNLVVVCAAWAMFPPLRGNSTATGLLELFLAGFLCTAGFYAMSVFFATFLDDAWQVWGTMIAIGLLRWLTIRVPPPASFDVFSAIGNTSVLTTHQLPWGAMGVSVCIGVILFVAALKVLQMREY